MYINLQIAKQHLNIDLDYINDDQYITELIEVAEEVVMKAINEETLQLGSDGSVPKSLLHAALLLVGNYYANREAVAFANVSKVPLAFEYLINLYKKY